MRHLIRAFGVLALAAASATPVAAQIAGSGHDFSGALWMTNSEICVACHTPHNADQSGAAASAPLWNHFNDTYASYSTYSSTTLNAGVGGVAGQPSGLSKLCLSCHDGRVGLDAFGGSLGTPTETMTLLYPTSSFGVDLGNDHPISISYSAGDPELQATTFAPGGNWGTAQVSDVLFGAGTVECASCHDVHNGGDPYKMLVFSNSGSELCLGCHNK
ncbi:MAG TPA: cytochrome c3 family protein [Longimicrobiales bacterium]|nr:cytochrome c3 family protein [Longimicrobiales bacterium]